jgi:hypothetical protein
MISILSYYTARFSGMQRPGTSYLMIPVYTYIRAYNIALLFSWLPTFNAVSMNRWLYYTLAVVLISAQLQAGTSSPCKGYQHHLVTRSR